METDIKTGVITETLEPSKSVMVFGTTETDGILAKATEVANRLVAIVENSKLYVMIKDKKYVKAEGWTAMAAILGVFPSTEYCKALEREDEIAYEARVVLRHISGNEVGAGEAICSSRERNWGGRDEFAIKSMAQTRATGKACRLSFSWIMAMAGYQPTPAEEMTYEMAGDTPPIKMPQPKVSGDGDPTPETKKGPSPAKALTKEEIAHEVREPLSKFFAQLHRIARERHVAPDKLKWFIKETYQKDSSKDLFDSETLALIQLIQKGGIK